MLKRMRRRVGRIERRVRALPTYVVVVGSMLLGMLLTLMGESPPEDGLRPRKDEVWFPLAAGGESGELVVKSKQGTCRKDSWPTRAAHKAFVAVQIPRDANACTCLESLAVVGERSKAYPPCEAAGKVSYGAL